MGLFKYNVFLLFVLCHTILSDKFFINKKTAGPSSMDEIERFNDSGTLLESLQCNNNEVALVTNNNVSCMNKYAVNTNTGCSFKRFVVAAILLYPYTCNISLSNVSEISYDGAKNKKIQFPSSCINFTTSRQNTSVLKLQCNKTMFNPGRLYTVQTTCVQKLYKTTENKCFSFTIPGLVKVPKHPTIGTPIITTTAPPPPVDLTSAPKDNSSVAITTVVTKTSNDVTVVPPVDSAPNSSKIIIYIIIAVTVAIIIILSCLTYFLCCKRKSDKSDSMDMESLYAKPDISKKKKKKEKIASTSYFGASYDEVGALIPGVYEKRASTSVDDDATILHDRGLFSNDSMKLKLLEPSSAMILDDPYEIIGRSNSFNPSRNIKPIVEKNIENKDETDAHFPDPATFVITDKPFKPSGSLRVKQKRTSIKRGKFGESLNVHEDVTITPPTSKLSSVNNLNSIPNVIINGEEQNYLDAVAKKLAGIEKNTDHIDKQEKEVLEIDDSNNLQKSNSYEEIWDMNKKIDENPYESVPNLIDENVYNDDQKQRANTDPVKNSVLPSLKNRDNEKDKQNSADIKSTSSSNIKTDLTNPNSGPVNDSPKTESGPFNTADQDSGYEEIWSIKREEDKSTEKTDKEDIEKEVDSNKSSLNYPDVEIVNNNIDRNKQNEEQKNNYTEIEIN